MTEHAVLGRYAFFGEKILPLAEAKVSITAHAFNYGTAVFEGIRGYHAGGEIYLFRLAEHYRRMEQSASLLRIKLPLPVKELCELTKELVRRNGFQQDVYVRPIAFKSSPTIKLCLNKLEDEFALYVIPLGDYVATDRGLAVCTSSWRRTNDTAIPARAKITGSYVNSALAASEADENGFDEAILLNEDGHVSEGSGMNLFLLRRGRLITTPVTANILEGITRETVIEIAAKELGLETQEREIDRSELYFADEIFFCGTGAQIASVGSVDRKQIGDGGIGPVTSRLQKIYQKITHGQDPNYYHWLSPVYSSQTVEAGNQETGVRIER